MKVTPIGQSGYIVKSGKSEIVIDPYLSDSIEKVNPKSKRNVPVDESFLKIKPDILILTHEHLDHTDPETIPHYINENTSVTVLASGGAWAIARKQGGNNNYVLFNRHTSWTENGIRFTAVKAEHRGKPMALYEFTISSLANERISSQEPKIQGI